MLVRRGLGVDPTVTAPPEPGIGEKLWHALGETLPLGDTGVPVWVLVLGGCLLAASLFKRR